MSEHEDRDGTAHPAPLERAARNLEEAMIALQQGARNSRGLRVRLGGSYERTAIDFEVVRKWFEPSHVFIDGDEGKIAALRNLELLAAVMRRYLEYFKAGGKLAQGVFGEERVS